MSIKNITASIKYIYIFNSHLYMDFHSSMSISDSSSVRKIVLDPCSDAISIENEFRKKRINIGLKLLKT